MDGVAHVSEGGPFNLPWTVGVTRWEDYYSHQTAVLGADGTEIGIVAYSDADDDGRTTAARLVASVNVLAAYADPAAVIRERDALRRACRAILLFHRGGCWTEAERAEWMEIVGMADCTTRAVCGMAMAALALAPEGTR